MNKLPIFAILLFALCGNLLAATPVTDAEVGQPPAMLGLRLAEIPEGLRYQLGDQLPTDQGILVSGVHRGGPADRAGILRYDILLSYSDQKLFSTRQLVALVRSDQPGHKVQLQLLRAGKPQSVTVTLGASRRIQNQDYGGFYPHHREVPMAPFGYKNFSMPRTPSAWDEFESIRVQTLADGRYRAEVKYKDNSDQAKSFTFEGKREELIDQINKQQDLEVDKKRALLHALNFSPRTGFDHHMLPDPYFPRPFDNDRYFRGFPDMRMPNW